MRGLHKSWKGFMPMLLAVHFAVATLCVGFLHTHHDAPVCRQLAHAGHCIHKSHVSTEDVCQICAAHFLDDYLNHEVQDVVFIQSKCSIIPVPASLARVSGISIAADSRGPPATPSLIS